MKILKTEVVDYLKSEPQFRERSNKDRGIVNLLMRRYPSLKGVIQNGGMKKEVVTAIVQDYASMDRAWRKCLEEEPALRGSDYGDKERLEGEALEELGYPSTKHI